MQKHGFWHRTKRVHFQALLLPIKFLHLSEFHLLCKAGTVTALPRRAGGGTKGNRACKGSPGAITPQKRSAVIPRPLAPSLSVFPVRFSAPAGTMSFFVFPTPDLVVTQWIFAAEQK